MASKDKTQESTNGSSTGTAVQVRPSEGVRRWDPFDMFDDLEQQMSQFWNTLWPRSSRSFFRPADRFTQDMRTMTWAPTMDVYEQGGNLVVKADLPGVKKDDINIELDRDSLVLRGQRQSENEVREDNYYRLERSAGSFYRRLPLPEGIKADQIKASFNEGVLEVRLPKPEQEQPQRQKIPITTS